MFFGLTWACHRCFCWSPNRHRPVTNVSSCCIYLGKKSPPVCRGRGPPTSMCFLANRPFLLGDFVSGVPINGSQCFHLGGKFLCNGLPTLGQSNFQDLTQPVLFVAFLNLAIFILQEKARLSPLISQIICLRVEHFQIPSSFQTIKNSLVPRLGGSFSESWVVINHC